MRALVVAAIALYAAPSFAASLAEDARILRWARQFEDGRAAQVAADVEKDLVSASPHPWSAQIWTQCHDAAGDLEAAVAKLTDGPLKTALGPLPEMLVLRRKAGALGVVKRFGAQVQTLPQSALVQFLSCLSELNRTDGAVEALGRTRPGDFNTLWMFETLAQADLRVTEVALSNVVPRWGDTADAAFLRATLPWTPRDSYQRLSAGEAFLKAAPDEPYALIFRARRLHELERYDAAVESYARARKLYPFERGYFTFELEALLRLGRRAEAERLIERDARLWAAAPERTNRRDLQLARALLNAGDRGEARSVLSGALQRAPDDPDLLMAWIDVETGDDRPVQAVASARKLVDRDPHNPDYVEALLRTLRTSGSPADALERYDALAAGLTDPRASVLYQAWKAAETLERTDRVRELLERAYALHPNLAWVAEGYARLLIKLDDAARAKQVLQTANVLNVLDALIDTERALGGEEAAVALRSKLRERYPFARRLWELEAEKLPASDVDAKVAFWKRAQAANPARYWGADLAHTTLWNAKREREAIALADAAVPGIVAQGAPGEIAGIHWVRVWSWSHLLRRSALSKDELKAFEAALEDYRKAGGYEAAYQRERVWLLLAQDRKEEAGLALQAALRIRPDDDELVENMFVTDAIRQIDQGLRFSLVYEYARRRPYQLAPNEKMVRFHALWGGSAVIALKTLQRLKRDAPDLYTRLSGKEADCYNKLEDYHRYFRDDYADASSIAASDRYVGWYRNALQNVRKESSTVTIDPNEAMARIVRPNGDVVVVKDHPVTGRPVLRQVGRAWVKAEYDPKNFQLTHALSSAGAELTLVYDAKMRIKSLRRGKGPALEFEYNDLSKPVHMSKKGVGELRVTYDEKGEIKKVDSGGGRKIALEITSDFQYMLDLIRGLSSLDPSQLSGLAPQDKALLALRQKLAQQFDDSGSADPGASFALASYLADHADDSPTYVTEANRLFAQVIFQGTRPGAPPAVVKQAGGSLRKLHTLFRKVRPEGLGADDFRGWTAALDQMREALLRAPRDSALKAALADVDRAPLQLLPAARWLPRSHLNLDGYWRRYTAQELLPKALQGARLQAVLLRRSGDVVVGTDKGLTVRSRGFWTWYGLDEARTQLRRDLETGELRAGSNVTALAETADGTLFVGTANGLLVQPPKEGASLLWLRTREHGLPSPHVEKLVALGDEVFAATDEGLARFGNDGRPLPVPATFQGTAIKVLAAADERPAAPRPAAPDEGTEVQWDEGPGEDDGAEGGVVGGVLGGIPSGSTPPPAAAPKVMVGTASGLYAFDAAQPVKWGDAVDAALPLSVGEGVMTLVRGVPYRLRAAGASPERLPDAQNIVKNKAVWGLERLDIGVGVGTAVLTDQGLSIFHEGHFEHVQVRDTDKVAGVRALSAQGARAFLLTDAGLVGIEHPVLPADGGGQVYDLLTLDDLDVTLVARGESLEGVFHNAVKEGARLIANIGATHLARDPDDGIITNDGNRILRIDPADGSRGFIDQRLLFEAATSDERESGQVTSLLAASDRSVWVTTPGALFRWKEGKLDVFSIYRDANAFPIRTDMISRVVETVDHRIWVVGSSESHRDYNGLVLEGGVVEFDGKAFKRLDLKDQSNAWFLRSYTKVDDETAIVGTTNGFARHRPGRYQTFETDLKDTSYLSLRARTPLLWLGTKGAKLGDDTWLFGAAGGVVAWHAGQWFYPSRLNWMLPDPEYAQYGGRHVDAVATDRQGRVYLGTQRGLAIYDAGDGTAFLMNNVERDAWGQLFARAEADKLQQEAAALLPEMSRNRDVADRVAALRDNERALSSLQAKLEPGARPKLENDTAPPEDTDALRKLVVERERKQKQLLYELQQDNLSLYQMLELKPLDLAALHARLAEGEVVVQYLPTPSRLFIHLVTKDGTQVREVEVSAQELNQRARDLANAIARRSGEARGAVAVGVAGIPLPAVDIQKELAWLYQQLLLPVEDELALAKHVFVVPVGALSYVPFSALVSTPGPRPKYAVERFNIGYLPSLYFFDLVFGRSESQTQGGVVMGDPDGSLPGARQEASEVSGVLGSGISPYLGERATLENLTAQASRAGVLHLATHGVLDPKRPAKSYLLLAGGKKLDVIDAMSLPLSKTRLVTLSACESGLGGGSGLEFATIARSFAQAGASSIVATLWQVNDAASRKLVVSFYRHLDDGDDRFVALAKAQRELLADKSTQNPYLWSGYVVFGRP